MKKIQFNSLICLISICTMLLFSDTVFAAEATLWTGAAQGSYQHPSTGVVADSGGAGNEALGQSMVENVVGQQALLEELNDGIWLSVRLHLMNSISSVTFFEENNDGTWRELTATQTANSEDTADFCMAVSHKDAILRVECYVDAMGRAVVFYVTVDNLQAGNLAGFTQHSLSGNGIALDDTEGLTFGIADDNMTAPVMENTEETQTLNVQNIRLDASVWWTAFLVILVADFVSMLLVIGIKYLIGKFVLKKRMGGAISENIPLEEEGMPLEELDLGWENEIDETKA